MSDPRLRRAPIELRASTDTPGQLDGYATVYDVNYRIGFGLREEIAPAAFAASLAQRDGVIPIFYMHDWDNPIGVAQATEDAHGVRVRVQLFIAENERSRSVWLAAKAGALREWSIGFYPSEITTRTLDDGTEIERVTVADLAEASIVVRGANPVTEMLSVRKRAAEKLVPVVEALRAKIATASLRDSDADEDPGAVAQALDAVIDLIFDEVSEGDMDPESLVALLTALDVLVDRLLELLGVDDPGEDEDTGSTYPSYFADNFQKPHVRELLRGQISNPV